MSRAEMFLAWCEDFFGEVADFLVITSWVVITCGVIRGPHSF